MEDPNPDVFLSALGEVAKVRGIAALAKRSGFGRESLYKTLSADGNPGFGSVLKVLGALGYSLELRTRPRPRQASRSR